MSALWKIKAKLHSTFTYSAVLSHSQSLVSILGMENPQSVENPH